MSGLRVGVLRVLAGAAIALALVTIDLAAASADFDDSVAGAAVVAARDGKVYRMGGFDPALGFLTRLEVFDPLTEQWKRRANMLRPRYGHAAAEAANGRIYVLGGYYVDPGLGYLDLAAIYPDEVDEYDPVTDTWGGRATLSLPRAHLSAVSRGRTIFVLGGHHPGRGQVRSVDEYDTEESAWTRRADLPMARSGLLATAAADGRIFALAGGGVPYRRHTLDMYDSFADRWLAVIGS